MKNENEQYYEETLDHYGMIIAKKMGYVSVMWLTTAKFFTYGQLLLSAMTGFMKPDYMAMTAVAIALFYFYNPDNIRKSGFKFLTLMLIASIIYDLVWVFFITDFGDSESSNDYREASVRLFSLRVCYVSILWRVSKPLDLTLFR